MHCNDKEVKCLEVETESAIYDIELGPIQIEITGRCNMNCAHCRASEMPKEDMPLNEILKIVKFARTYSPNYKEITISGGEPLLHREFRKVICELRKNGADYLAITTNGSLITEDLLDFFESLEFERLMLSVSVDSTKPEKHDAFRGYNNAFNKAVTALKMISSRNSEKLVPSMKTVIMPDTIDEMAAQVALADNLGCKRISFTSVIYSGKAKTESTMWMTSKQKKQFLENIYRLKREYPHINVTTNDPLKCLIRGISDEPTSDSEIVMDGCPAATVSFNVNSDGVMTPCSLLNIPMMNTFELTAEEIAEKYQNNEITKMFLEMHLHGKCSDCSKKYSCCGCRARALAYSGDIMGEDPECWI